MSRERGRNTVGCWASQWPESECCQSFRSVAGASLISMRLCGVETNNVVILHHALPQGFGGVRRRSI